MMGPVGQEAKGFVAGTENGGEDRSVGRVRTAEGGSHLPDVTSSPRFRPAVPNPLLLVTGAHLGVTRVSLIPFRRG